MHDKLTNARLGIDYPHHETHEGEKWEFNYAWTGIGAAGTVAFRFATNPGKKHVHAYISVHASGGCNVAVYEHSNFAHVGGNALPFKNTNRNYHARQPSGMKEACHTPSGSETADVYKSWRVGGFRAQGDRAEEEIILKQDCVYSIITTADGAGTDINMEVAFYEKVDYSFTTTTTSTTTTTT